jgi:hypothetical protein
MSYGYPRLFATEPVPGLTPLEFTCDGDLDLAAASSHMHFIMRQWPFWLPSSWMNL